MRQLANVSEVPSFILESVPTFGSSPELQRLDPSLRSIPGLITGQLTIFLRRLVTQPVNNRDGAAELADVLRDVFETIEALASSPDNDIQNLVIVEVLEHLHVTPEALKAIVIGFGPATRQLYTEWIDPGPKARAGPQGR